LCDAISILRRAACQRKHRAAGLLGTGAGWGAGARPGRYPSRTMRCTAPFTTRLELSASPTLAVLLAALHLAGAAGLLASPLPAWLGPLAAVAVLASLPRSLARHALLGAPDAVVSLARQAGGGWALRTRAGRELRGRELAGSIVTRALVVLELELGSGARRVVLIAADMVPADALRRLRAALRSGG